jgi:glutathione S-transferase
VDAVFGPVFRYFDVFDCFVDLRVFEGLPKTTAWRQALSAWPSVQGAVGPDYPERLRAFLVRQGGQLGQLARQLEQAA